MARFPRSLCRSGRPGRDAPYPAAQAGGGAYTVRAHPVAAGTAAPAVLVALVLVLSGCGQKGPLYRPEPAQDLASPEPAPASLQHNAD
ncbi:LPS translocon maturation chaperone LptM [Thiohalorhabdus denitrificans]|uniref:Lipoprotein-attachment site-containing protein n=1 Tax=Thiohalorhabdus denitrificans TaxID=381306 RepID=A0A1G5GAG4_9GAMM|nr:lipoprotein-attachment site-containing protein [Thiohalorhabdus denitrificans]